MSNLVATPLMDEKKQHLYRVVVETPRGATAKMSFDETNECFQFDRALPVGLAYPFHWGFFPSTRAEDGDPLDAMVLLEAPAWPGLVLPSRPIGLLELVQADEGEEKQRNDRIILVDDGDPRKDIHDLTEREREDLAAFFVNVGSRSHREVSAEGWKGRKAAEKAIEAARVAFGSSKGH